MNEENCCGENNLEQQKELLNSMLKKCDKMEEESRKAKAEEQKSKSSCNEQTGSTSGTGTNQSNANAGDNGFAFFEQLFSFSPLFNGGMQNFMNNFGGSPAGNQQNPFMNMMGNQQNPFMNMMGNQQNPFMNMMGMFQNPMGGFTNSFQTPWGQGFGGVGNPFQGGQTDGQNPWSNFANMFNPGNTTNQSGPQGNGSNQTGTTNGQTSQDAGQGNPMMNFANFFQSFMGNGQPPWMNLAQMMSQSQMMGGSNPLFNMFQGMPNQEGAWKEFMENFSKASFAQQTQESGSDQQSQTENKDEEAPSPLVAMKPSGSKTPFFCVHALLGSVFNYYPLANMMDPDQPFYALQAPGLDGKGTPLDEMQKFVELYIKHIKSVQPEGPYKIGGYSLGGWIAFAIAHELMKMGDEVSFLGIFGSSIPISVSTPQLFEVVGFFQQYLKDFHDKIVMPFLSYEQRMAKESGEENKNGISTSLINLLEAHNRAALFFNPYPYPGKITLFETLEQQSNSPLDSSRGWRRLSSFGVDSFLVSGNHLSMFAEPHIRDLGEKLRDCLRKCC